MNSFQSIKHNYYVYTKYDENLSHKTLCVPKYRLWFSSFIYIRDATGLDRKLCWTILIRTRLTRDIDQFSTALVPVHLKSGGIRWHLDGMSVVQNSYKSHSYIWNSSMFIAQVLNAIIHQVEWKFRTSSLYTLYIEYSYRCKILVTYLWPIYK